MSLIKKPRFKRGFLFPEHMKPGISLTMPALPLPARRRLHRGLILWLTPVLLAQRPWLLEIVRCFAVLPDDSILQFIAESHVFSNNLLDFLTIVWTLSQLEFFVTFDGDVPRN